MIVDIFDTKQQRCNESPVSETDIRYHMTRMCVSKIKFSQLIDNLILQTNQTDIVVS